MKQSNMRGKYQYRAIQTKEFVDGIGVIETYGIELALLNERLLILDVSTDLDKIMMLETILNYNNVSPSHLRDVIEDFLENL